MKGIILAGGNGTRLYPNTKVTNKHLLPVYNKPMIYYPIENMLKAGIDEILIMPGKDHAGDFAKLLGSGKDFNAKFTFIVQDYAGGCAYPIKLIKNFVGDDDFLYIFGDNIFDYDFSDDVKNFNGGAKIFCKEVDDPSRFGVAVVDGDKVTNIIEKPSDPPSNWAVTGAYMYDNKALSFIDELEPSARGEFEITDLNNKYIQAGKMKASFLKGGWYDTGTHASLAQAAYDLMLKDQPQERLKSEHKNSPHVAIGFVLFQAREYLPYFLESIYGQDYKNVSLYALNANEDENHEDVVYLKEHYPDITILNKAQNTGFAAGHNSIIRHVKDKAHYYAAVNFDMIFEQDFISKLVDTALESNKFGSITGKIKRWNFSEVENDSIGKTNFIDTVGLEITKEHRFFNKGEGEIDHGQYDEKQEIFGASGSALLFSLNALKDIAYVNEDSKLEFFDELMFMYKEDVDIAYRLQWAGYTSYYTPEAIAYHDRSVDSTGSGIFATIKRRLKRSSKVNEWAWINHHIILDKYLGDDVPYAIRLQTFWYEIKSFVYSVLFERHLIKHFFKVKSMSKEIAKRRKQLKKRESYDVIRKWMK